MAATLFTSIIAYVSTNIDDIFILMLLLAQAPDGRKGKLIAGHFMGVGILIAASMLGAFGLQNLPLNCIGILGLVPIVLGLRAWMEYRNHSENSNAAQIQTTGSLSMALITLGNGADNLGVYIPLFTGFSHPERICAVVTFTVMTALWILLANTLAEFPEIKRRIIRYKPVLIPIVFILLGIYILLG